jgi:hypothetical protein
VRTSRPVKLHQSSPEHADLVDAEIAVLLATGEKQRDLRQRILERARELSARLTEPEAAKRRERDARAPGGPR